MAVLWGASHCICLKERVVLLCSSLRAFSSRVYLMTKLCFHKVVLTRLLLDLISEIKFPYN